MKNSLWKNEKPFSRYVSVLERRNRLVFLVGVRAVDFLVRVQRKGLFFLFGIFLCALTKEHCDEEEQSDRAAG